MVQPLNWLEVHSSTSLPNSFEEHLGDFQQMVQPLNWFEEHSVVFKQMLNPRNLFEEHYEDPNKWYGDIQRKMLSLYLSLSILEIPENGVSSKLFWGSLWRHPTNILRIIMETSNKSCVHHNCLKSILEFSNRWFGRRISLK